MRIKRVHMTLDGATLFSLYIPRILNKTRARLWTQLGVVLLLVGIGLSTRHAAIRGGAIVFGILWMLDTTDLRKENREGLGLRWKNSNATLWMLNWGAYFLVLIVWLIGLLWGPARHINYSPERLIIGKVGYFFGAALQQLVIQSYFFIRLEKLLNCPNRARKWTAWIFALCHTPNPLLMAIAWGGGYMTNSIFRRYRNIWTLALAHGMVGAAIAAFWPSWVMRAGIGFAHLLLGKI